MPRVAGDQDPEAAGRPRVFDCLLRSIGDGYVSHRYGGLPGTELSALTDADLKGADAVLLLTDHDAFDYDRIVRLSQLVIDTRNATKNVRVNREKIVLA